MRAAEQNAGGCETVTGGGTIGHWVGRVAVCLVLATLPAISARALETTLDAPGAPDDLVGRLKAASLSLSAAAREVEAPQEILAAARSDYRAMISTLYDAGYYSPVIRIRVDGREAANIPPLETPRSISKIAITIEPGRAFRFGKAEIGPLAPGTELPAGFATGQPAPSGLLQSTSQASIGQWREFGHAKARISGQKIVARHSEAILDAQIFVDPGQRMTFGRSTITGNSRVRTDAIARIAGFPTGEVFSPDEARRAASRLRRTGAFSSVSLKEAETANPDRSVDFQIEVVEAKRRRIQFGAEIASTQGLELSFKWVHRNLFGGAERLTFDSRIRSIGGGGDIDGRVVVRLDRPAFFGADNDLFYLFDLEILDEQHYRLFRSQLGVGWRRTYSSKLYAEVGVAANYNKSDDVFGTDRKFYFLSLPSRLRWDRRDNPTNATRGFYLNVDATPFAGFKGTESGLHTLVDARTYWALGADNRVVLAGRVQAGTVLGASLRNISPDLLFYSGGAGSVRGQPFESLGIPVGTGTAGGQSFLGLSAEVRTRLTEKFSVVGFFDYGAVGSGQFISETSPSHSGAGLGVRYDVGGIGALRLDVAYPVDGSTSNGVQFYFGIGQAF